MEKITINNIDTLKFSSSKKQAIVLFHGYGADCNDLAPLKQYLDPNDNYDWFFPNGIMDLKEQGMPGGRSWFSIDIESWFEKSLNNQWDEIYSGIPNYFEESRDCLAQFLASIQKEYEHVSIGGFSQGGIMSVQLIPFLNLSKIKSLILYSCSMINFPNWKKSISDLSKDFSIFQSHGENDPVILYKMGHDLNKILTDNIFKTNFYSFSGGHEIPMSILDKTKIFLSSKV